MPSDDSAQKLSSEELSELNQQFDRQLKNLRANRQRISLLSPRALRLKKLLFYILSSVVVFLAPFVVLIRTSVYMYFGFQLNGWLALSVGVLMTIALLLGYVIFILIRFSQHWRLNKFIRHGITVLVVAYTLYGLLYYSGMNTKTEVVRNYYRTLHPIMRVAISTATFADSDIVVTDIRRQPGDYEAMGLPENRESLHYEQSDGYVYAIDLRTKRRAEWKNWLMETGLQVMGLQTLRHEGTSDHLHVYLPLND